jgi:cold shock CspA family protein
MDVKDENKQEFGTVGYINDEKGFAFIRQRLPYGETKSYFCHFSKIIQGREFLAKGARAFFTVQPDPRGPVAVDVVLKSAPPKFQKSLTLEDATRKILDGVGVQAELPKTEVAQ